MKNLVLLTSILFSFCDRTIILSVHNWCICIEFCNLFLFFLTYFTLDVLSIQSKQKVPNLQIAIQNQSKIAILMSNGYHYGENKCKVTLLIIMLCWIWFFDIYVVGVFVQINFNDVKLSNSNKCWKYISVNNYIDSQFPQCWHKWTTIIVCLYLF